KIWLDGTAEPAAWNVSVTDSSAGLQAAGNPGVNAFGQGSTSYPFVFSYDDFTVRPANLPPVASFNATCGGSLGCDVDASASSDDNAIATYQWVFGDGATSTGVTASHTYASA